MEIQGTYRLDRSDSNETCYIRDISDNTDRSDNFKRSASDSRYQEMYKCWNAGAAF